MYIKQINEKCIAFTNTFPTEHNFFRAPQNFFKGFEIVRKEAFENHGIIIRHI